MPLSPNASAAEIIHDFVHSKNKRFEGKDKKTRIRMALGAYYESQAKKHRKKLKAKKKKKSLNKTKLKEDVAVNNIGGGNIEGAGIGSKGEPGVKKNRKRKLVMAFVKRCL